MAYRGPVHRWDVFRADLEHVVGREQGGENRPVVVVSNDGFNRRFDVITVVPLTKLEGKKRQPFEFEVVLPPGTVGTGVTSLVQVYQIRTIAKIRLLERMGKLDDPEIQASIEAAVMSHIGIEFDLDEDE